MIRKAFKTCAAGFAAGLGLLGGALPAMGQTPPTTGVPGDWPNLGAFNNRQGRNVSPFGYNSGQTFLRYEYPNTTQERNSLTLDNTDLQANQFSNGGPYDDPIYSAPFPATGPRLSYASVSSIAAWPVPAQSDYAAASIDPPATRARDFDATRPQSFAARPTEYFTGSSQTSQYPSYNYAYGVPSDPAGDGTTAANNVTASYFQWKFVPPAGNTRTFALYTYIPEGTTYTNPKNGGQPVFLYPQRYFVYEIRFGPDRDNNGIPDNRIVDVLDTETSGGGYVRLGVTGSEASTYFPANGDPTNVNNPSTIQVRLYNTVPRDPATGKLLLPNAPAAGASNEAAFAAQRLVYADASRITPFTGGYAASPTTTTLSGNTANGPITSGAVGEDVVADWNLTLARTDYAYNFTPRSTSTTDEGVTVNGTLQLGTDGTVSNLEANPATPTGTNFAFDGTNFQPYLKWRYSLSSNQQGTTTLDNTSAGVTSSGGFSASTVNTNHIGVNYLSATVAATSSASVTYAPDLGDGDYDVYAYVPGNYPTGSATPTESYATALLYEIRQGSTVVYSGTLNESLPLGWVHLGGNARFANTQTALPNAPLTVVFYNQASAADVTANRLAYVDAVRFVGQANSGFTSTPIHASVRIAGQTGDANGNTKVVLVADDNGVLHCLDETGNSDGTTTEYWSYPSTPDGTTSYKDPNIWQVNGNGSGVDGVPNTASTTTPYDNTPTAVMPTGFDLSTAAVAHVPVSTANGTTTYEDRLYVGATNGRVYCIDMSGRGDYSVANRTVGTTQRRWTFPDDYDPSNPTAPSGTGTIGAFRGSVVFGYPSSGVSATPAASDNPTVYVGASQGRVYALDAVGDTTTTHTGVRWQFPLSGQSNLPRISMTPTLFSPQKVSVDTTTNRLLFGTQFDSTNDGPGQFYCLSAATGTPYWAYNDQRTTAQGGLANPDARVTATGLDGFVAGPVAVPYTTLDISPTTITQGLAVRPAHFDTVYALNQNGYLFGLNVDNGFLVSDQGATGQENGSAHVYITDALNAVTSQSLTFTFATSYVANATDVTTGLQTFPMIVIPGDNGVLSMVAARPEDYNEDTDTTTDADFPTATYDYRALDPLILGDTSASWTSTAASNNFLFANDTDGVAHAFDNVGGVGTTLNPAVDSGNSRGISPNDPRADAFKRLQVRLINRKGYAILKTVVNATTNQGPLDHDTAVNRTSPGNGGTLPAGDLSKNYGTTGVGTGVASNPYGFEWGETAYIFVYNFPYAERKLDPQSGGFTGDPVEPPTISVQIQVEGRIVRTPTSRAMKFAGTTSATVGGQPADGYAVLSYALNSSGASALAPGTGHMTASISTSALTGSEGVINQPRRGGSTVFFVVANPLAIAVYNPTTGAYVDSIGGTLNTFLTNGAAPENAVNGTPAIGAQGTYLAEPLKSQLHASAPLANNGASTTARVSVYDRSLIALLHEDGLSNFRVTRSGLQRQGGYRAVYARLNPFNATNPLDPTGAIYPGFEDRPTVDGTNTSLDYPDIGREQVRAILSSGGAAENPVTVASTLLPPKVQQSGGALVPLNANNVDSGARVPTATPLDLTIDVPRYQPPVGVELMPGYDSRNPSTPVTTPDAVKDLLDVRHDSLGYQIPFQGYFGRISAFIDSNNDNKLTQDTSKEVYRAFNFSTNVLPQYSVLVGSPTVDLGSLASGTGYAPAPPATLVTATSALDGGSGPFSPWNSVAGSGNWSPAYRTVIVRNDGNLNLLDLRLAKGTSNNGGSVIPWALPTADNDPLAWMTASLRGGITGVLPNDGLNAGDLWSNFDSTYAARNRFASGSNLVILPKPRVTDRVPSELVANPFPRANPNLALRADGNEVVKGTTGSRIVNGTSANRLDQTVPSSAPKVAVSVPIGFPVGSYSAQVRVVENIIPVNGVYDNDILQMLNQATEVYSDPLTLTYKVRETRMTNRSTPRTAFVIDNPNGFPNIPTGWPRLPNSDGKLAFRNSNPTAMRETGGALDVIWESDRENVDLTKAQPDAVSPSRIYFGRMDNQRNNANPVGYNPPLWDLSQFSSSTSQWFTTGAGFPNSGQANALFGGNTVAETVTYGSPSLPARGQINPLSPRNAAPTAFGGGIAFGFVGDAQVQTATARISNSRVFLTTVAPGQNGGLVPDAAGVRDMGGDPQTKKGKPSVVQLSTGPLVFFSETSAGQSGITASRLVNGQAVTVPLGFGDGFSSVFSPSANARPYVGADRTLNSTNGTGAIVDLSFAGKLRGRANAEVYLGRLRLNASTGGLIDGGGNPAEAKNAGSPFALLPEQGSERAVGEANGVYRTRGVDWDPTKRVLVQQWIGGNYTDLLVAGTGAVDRQSGIASYDSRLGGKVYIDPNLGTIRFASAFPNRNADIRVTYTPYFLRVTPGGTAGYSAVNGLWDDRYTLDNEFDANGNAVVVAPGYWFADTQQHLQSSGDPTARGMRSDRYFFAYGRGAAGGGVTARPYTTTMRIGVRLPTRIATDNQGQIVDIQVTGNTRPYQVDPANGRVYLMAEDEDRPITVIYRGVDESTNLPTGQIRVVANASFVLEKTETPVAVDEAANETAVTAFVDPITSTSAPRPPLYWLFYVSTRAGGPDLYFQSIAPRYTPFAK